jgi:uncharacterized protein (TIGR03437 family)
MTVILQLTRMTARELGMLPLLGVFLPLMAQQYSISTLAGGSPPPLSTAPLSASIGMPSGIAVDPTGAVYFTSQNCVFKLGGGVVTRVAGTSIAGYSGDGGPATEANLNLSTDPVDVPSGLAVDNRGNVYIADAANFRIRKVSPNGVISTVAGNGMPGYSGDGGPATSAELSGPYGLAADASGSLYITDDDGGIGRIRKVTAAGTITTIAGNGLSDYSGLGGPATAAALSSPRGVAVDLAGDIFVSEVFGRILRISPNNTITLVTVLKGPLGLAVDANGALYVADGLGQGVERISGTATRIAGTGSPGYSGDGGQAGSAQLNYPMGVAVDSVGTVYISDSRNNRIRSILPSAILYASGTITTVAGNGTSGAGTASAAQFAGPVAVSRDAAGNVYVVDPPNYRIQKISSSGLVSTVAGNGTFGLGIANRSQDGGLAVNASLTQPRGVTVDSAGNLYFTDYSSVRKVSTNGIISTFAGTDTFSSVAGCPGDGGQATSASMSQPEGIVADTLGNVYVSDIDCNSVRKIAPNGIITTVAGNGTSGYSGDGGPATSAQLFVPRAVATDNSGNIYIADCFNGRVRKVSANGVISTVAGSGNPFGPLGDGGPATAAALRTPAGVAAAASGDIYISDSDNNRIRRVLPNGIIITIAGNGEQGFSGDGGLATNAMLAGPWGVAIDSSGDVYVADTGNSRIRVLKPAPLSISSNSTLPGATVGVPYSYQLVGSGGSSVYQWTLGSGALPAGLNLSSSGLVSGTPTISGTVSFRVQLADSAGGTVVSGFVINVLPAPLAFGPTAPPAGQIGSSYSFSLPVSGGTPPYSWTVLSGTLPSGLALSSAGVISGTPTVAGASNVVIQVTDSAAVTATRSYSVVINPSAIIIIAATSFPALQVGTQVSLTLSASGGNPPYSWSIKSGTLPAGLVLSLAGVISGTPTVAGTATFIVQVTDHVSSTATQSYSVTVAPSPLSLAAGTPPVGRVGTSYSLTLSASGGTPPYQWSIQSGALPPGLTLTASGSISGSPSAAGTYTFTVVVADSNSGSVTQQMVIVINFPSGYAGPPSIFPNGIVSGAGLQVTLQPGSWATVFGQNLSATSRDWNSGDFTGGAFPTSLDSVSVSIAGKAGYVRSISPGQINFQVPDGIGPGNAVVTVTNAAGTSVAQTVVVSNLAPAFFVGISKGSRSYVAATKNTPDGTVYIGPAGTAGVSPAAAGDVITLWGTGFGLTQPSVPAGAIFMGSAPMILPVQIFIDGISVVPQFAGMTAAGLYQINVALPDLGPGDHTLYASVGGVTSPDGTWIATQ